MAHNPLHSSSRTCLTKSSRLNRQSATYQAAILETDDNKLPNRLQAAKAAIDNRIHELQTDHGGTPEEWQAITDALGRS